jgi:uncharacterized DUF497 family protein
MEESHSKWRRWCSRTSGALWVLDNVDETGEQRWHVIGAARLEPDSAVVLFVVHAYREDSHDEEVIRIISARRAEKYELRRYQKQKMD